MDKKCFIICPIGKEGSETRKRSNTVYDYLLTPVCKKLNYEIIRSDKIASADKIDIEILNYLDSAGLAIADLTDLNPNVFYEVGYRKAKGLPCVQIALEGTKLPFDVTTFRTHFYSISDLAKSEEFKTILENVIRNIQSKSKENVVITKSNLTENLSLQEKCIEIEYIVTGAPSDVSKKFTQKKSVNEIFKQIGLILINEKNQNEIERLMNHIAIRDFFYTTNIVNPRIKLYISEASINEVLLYLLTLNYITINLNSSPSTYVLTELGRSTLVQLREEQNNNG